MAGIVHFSNFFRYLEICEHDFFLKMGFSIHGGVPGKRFGFPRVHAECNYRKPLRFEEIVSIKLYVVELGHTSIIYAFECYVTRKRRHELVATAKLKVVCVVTDLNEKIIPQELPLELKRKMKPHPQLPPAWALAHGAPAR